MTLGKKLSCYRKLAGMTQQQLGAHLNLSAQAISKWEKDLTEPDLSTLRALAELYKVTVDELLDPEGGFPDAMALNPDAEPVEEEQEMRRRRHRRHRPRPSAFASGAVLWSPRRTWVAPSLLFFVKNASRRARRRKRHLMTLPPSIPKSARCLPIVPPRPFP